MKSVLAWRRGAEHVPSSAGEQGRAGELKRRWTKPPARSLGYGDLMMPAVCGDGFGSLARLILELRPAQAASKRRISGCP